MSGTIGIAISIIAYMAMMLAIGFWTSKKTQNSDDFYLGGRQLGPVVTAMSAEASDMSSWLLMGLPGVAYITGVADAAWTAIGLAIGTYLNWLIVAKRLRRYSERVDAITIPSYFSKRYHDNSKILVGVSAVWILIFFIPYTASGFAACGKLFSTLFGLDYSVTMFVSAAVIVAYTMLGGFLAASTTDLIQSIVMSIALLIVLFYGINVAGGWDAVVANAEGVKGYLGLMTMGNINTPDTSSSYSIVSILTNAAWGLGYFGMPHILLRFMAIRDEKEIKTSRRIASVWVVISMTVAIVIGIVSFAMSNVGAIPVNTTNSEAERSIIQIAQLLSTHGFAVALVAGLILAGILACTMSTSDSQLLTASSAFSENILVEVFGAQLSEKQRVAVGRITVAVIAVLGVFMAQDPNSSVFGIVSFAWAGFGASFGPVMLLSLFWKRSNRYGAIAGMVAGGVSVIVWKYLVRPMGGILDFYELLPAFIIALVVMIIVSLATPAPEQEIIEEFDEVVNG